MLLKVFLVLIIVFPSLQVRNFPGCVKYCERGCYNFRHCK